MSSTEAAEGEEPEEVTKVVKRTLFHRSNGYPQKKVLTFNRYSEDFSFQVFYGDLDFLSPDEKRWVCFTIGLYSNARTGIWQFNAVAKINRQ